MPTFISAIAVSLGLIAPWAASGDVSAPEWLTAQGAGGISSDEGRAVAVTGNGRTVVAGTFWGTTDFPLSSAANDSITLTSQGFNSAAFVAGLDANAEYFTWALPIVGSAFEVLPTAAATMDRATASASDDTVLVAGYFQGTAYFPTGPAADDSIALTSTGQTDGFIASVAPDGSRFEWARRIGPNVSDPGRVVRPRALTVDAAGGATLFGEFSTSQALQFPSSGSPVSLPASGTYAAFVGRFAAETGYFAWAQGTSTGGSPVYATGGTVAGASTATSADDRPVMVGTVNPGTTYFPTGRPAPDDSIALSATGSDLFVAAMNADDSYFSWVRGIPGPSSGVVAGELDGSIVLAGGYTGEAYFPRGPGDDSIALVSVGGSDAFVAKMSADDSYFDTAVSAGGSGSDRVESVTVTAAGHPVVGGEFSASMSFPSSNGSIDIASTGGTGAFVSQVATTSQAFDWAVSAAGTTNSQSAKAFGVASAPDGRVLMTGRFQGTIIFSGTVNPLALTSKGSNDVMVASIGTAAAPPPASPAPAIPASEPTNVTATPGDESATLSWTAPSSSGSYPVSHYLVTSSPGGRTCLVTAPTLTCEVAGLTNGTAYTFTVKALTGAGWSAASAPSNAVVPHAADKSTIVITGSREGQRIFVSGTAQGMGMGGMLHPWVRRAGQTSFAQGSATILVNMDGTFEWSRRSGGTVFVYVATPDGSMRSNTVRIPAG